MDKKQMYIEVINSETGKIFSLPTLYTDRTEACVCGQNYMRDRQAEDPCSKLFFRVLLVDNEWNEDEDEDEEPEHGESVYGNTACSCPDKQEDCFGCPNFSECWE